MACSRVWSGFEIHGCRCDGNYIGYGKRLFRERTFNTCSNTGQARVAVRSRRAYGSSSSSRSISSGVL